MVPFEVTATASDNLSGVASVELFYRYSPDNIIFGSWVSYSADNEEPWSWTFDTPEGDVYYEFHSIATDEANNVEEGPEVADTVCGVDTVPPESSVNR
ncbi:MAG: Ig-like domain-containing protein, partial [Hadesarchaea archaeon]|nr:Ig-like domain-containing protein [Hadesarchaea archaeon]